MIVEGIKTELFQVEISNHEAVRIAKRTIAECYKLPDPTENDIVLISSDKKMIVIDYGDPLGVCYTVSKKKTINQKQREAISVINSLGTYVNPDIVAITLQRMKYER